MLWYQSGRVVVADSYFALVECAEELLKRNLKFIGVVKASHWRYSLHHLQRVELAERGDRFGLVSHNKDEQP
jgi:hypothetical protein